MLCCLDVHYLANAAHAAAVTFDEWTAAVPVAQFTATVETPAEYQAGQFYLRELSPLLAVIKKVPQPIDGYVIDGYCYLSPELAPGLGAYLFEALGTGAPIIGVAKNRYRDTAHAYELLRGGSHRPLFITAIGMTSEAAVHCIASMAGQHRVPTLLKAVDQLARASTAAPN